MYVCILETVVSTIQGMLSVSKDLQVPPVPLSSIQRVDSTLLHLSPVYFLSSIRALIRMLLNWWKQIPIVILNMSNTIYIDFYVINKLT